MEIVRKGNRKGLDVDYEVRATNPDDVDSLHKTILKDGLIFLYATGGKPYSKPDSNTILHYIDKDFILYDFAILFTKQPPKPKKLHKSKMDEMYDTAHKNPTFRRKLAKQMRFHMFLYAIIEHLKAYNHLQYGVLPLVKKALPDEKEYTLHSMQKVYSDHWQTMVEVHEKYQHD
jgi:hypothetical protein